MPTRGPFAHTSLFLLNTFLNDARTGMVKSPAVDECTDFNASRMFALYGPMDLSPALTAVHRSHHRDTAPGATRLSQHVLKRLG